MILLHLSFGVPMKRFSLYALVVAGVLVGTHAQATDYKSEPPLRIEMWGSHLSGSIDAQVDLIPGLPEASGDYDGYEISARIHPGSSGLFIDLSADAREGTVSTSTIFRGQPTRVSGSIDMSSWKAGVGYGQHLTIDESRPNALHVGASIAHHDSQVEIKSALLGLDESRSETSLRMQFDGSMQLSEKLTMGVSSSARVDGSPRNTTNTVFVTLPLNQRVFVAAAYRHSRASQSGFYSAVSSETLLTLGASF